MSSYYDLDDERIVYDRNSGEYAIYCVPLDMTSTDAVEVVRCKDCKHFNGNPDILGYYECTHFNAEIDSDNSFCSFGERRDYGKVH